jgi:threonine 3-dehydrogenase
VRIAVRRASICGTDLHIYEWDEWARKAVPVPVTLGHEFAGVIVEIGSEVQGYAVGDRVSAEGHITCGHCRNCRAGRRHLCIHTVGVGVQRNGGFAEYVAIPASNVFKLPVAIGDDLGAILDPFGNATHTALSFDLVGEDVLITGAGPIGIMACQIARFVGARHIVITDVNEYRLSLARQMGASIALDVRSGSIASTMKTLGMTEGFDVGFEMSGNAQALRDLIGAMHHGGHVALLGIPPHDVAIDWNQVIFKGLTLKGIYGREMFETWYKMASMLQSGLRIDPVITHRVPFTAFADAFTIMQSGQAGKILLEWSS